VHKQRNVLNAIPHRERKEVSTELAGIFKQENKEDAQLNLVAFKAKYQKRYPEAIHSLCEDEGLCCKKSERSSLGNEASRSLAFRLRLQRVQR
jgi:transposase-like protein